MHPNLFHFPVPPYYRLLLQHPFLERETLKRNNKSLYIKIKKIKLTFFKLTALRSYSDWPIQIIPAMPNQNKREVDF